MSVFFTDRDLGKAFPDVLKASGIAVEPHHEHFRHDTPDEEWIPSVARRGWVAITRDRHIRYKPNELKAVREAQLGLIVLVGKVPTGELARNFVLTADRIERFLARTDQPFIAKVFRASTAELASNPDAAGRIELWWPK